MKPEDFAEFTELLDDTCRVLSRGSYTPNARNAALWFSDLRDHSLDDVRTAFEAHRRDPDRGRFVPVPGDILGKLADRAQADGRPGPEEAWSIALAGRDERESVVVTDEIATAWGSAAPILRAGDEVGARMAFREVYSREIAAARAVGRPVSWRLSEGFDVAGRARALVEAATRGRIVGGATDIDALPAPRGPLLLPTPAADAGPGPDVIGRLRVLSAKLSAPGPEVASPCAEAIRDTRQRQRQLAARVADAPGQLQPGTLDESASRAQALAGLAEVAEVWEQQEREALQLQEDQAASAVGQGADS